MSEAADSLLQVVDVVKTFPGVRALDEVRFDVRRGEIYALVGENGAGKSTLMHVLGGVIRPEQGRICIDGRDVAFHSPADAARAGIAVVFQELSLCENLSIAENVFANRQPTGALGLIDGALLRKQAAEWLALAGLKLDPRTSVSELSASQRQIVEILKAAAQKPRILILDEPTSSLTAADTEILFQNLRRWQSEGMSFVYITHRMPEVFQLADRVTVLRDGRRVDTLDVATTNEKEIVHCMVGRELIDMYGEPTGEFGAEALRVERASRAGEFHEVDLTVRRGEIVGLAGLAGAGRTEFARALFGLTPLDAGRIWLGGAPFQPSCPSDAIAAGLAYMTEDRKADGLFLDFSIRANAVAPNLRRFAAKADLIDEAAVTAAAERACRRLGVAATSVHQTVAQLSGGNQQKVLLGAWVEAGPKVLLADEPTRGVDVGAKSEIYKHLRSLAKDGVAVVLVSSDLPELLGMCDRIVVMRNGELAGEFARAVATEQNVVACATGIGDR